MKKYFMYIFVLVLLSLFLISCGEKKEPIVTGDQAALELLKEINDAYDMGTTIGFDSSVSLVVKKNEEFNKKYELNFKDSIFKKLYDSTINDPKYKKPLEDKIQKLYEQKEAQTKIDTIKNQNIDEQRYPKAKTDSKK